MKIKTAFEWNEHIGIRVSEIDKLRDSIELFFEENSYGSSISEIWIVLTALDRDWKQRKRFKKKEKRFQYDILLDFFKILDAEKEEKKNIVSSQIIEITEATFAKYKFEDFDKTKFLTDFKENVMETQW